MVFQEASPLFLKTEGAALQRELPFAFYLQSEEGYWTQAIFSRYPLAEVAASESVSEQLPQSAR